VEIYTRRMSHTTNTITIIVPTKPKPNIAPPSGHIGHQGYPCRHNRTGFWLSSDQNRTLTRIIEMENCALSDLLCLYSCPGIPLQGETAEAGSADGEEAYGNCGAAWRINRTALAGLAAAVSGDAAHSGYIGTSKVAHLEENIAAAGLGLSAEDWAELESAASA
jgi:hypothetical protein